MAWMPILSEDGRRNISSWDAMKRSALPCIIIRHRANLLEFSYTNLKVMCLVAFENGLYLVFELARM